MKGKLALVCLVVALVVGCAAPSAGVIPGAEMKDGAVVFSAMGKSVVAKEGDPLSEVEAEVAAITMAKANLLEKIKGARIGGSITVGDLMFESQEATLEMMGYLSRAEIEVMKRAESRLGTPPYVSATASLRLSKADLAAMETYVE
jgi:hypothetical protein